MNKAEAMNKTAGETAMELFREAYVRKAYFGGRLEQFESCPENRCAVFKEGFANARAGMMWSTAVYYDVSSSYPAAMMVNS